MFKCEFCGKSFKTKKGLSSHRYQCRANPQKSDKMDYSHLHTPEIRQKISASNKGRKLSDEHKQNISVSMKRYCDENPDRIPYVLNHSSSRSWPEMIFEQLLIDAGITGWQYNYSHGRYRYDYAFPALKVDIEIDGATHRQSKVIKSDAERDNFARISGWRVLRIEAAELYDTGKRQMIVDLVVEFLNDDRIFGFLKSVKKEVKESMPKGQKLRSTNDEKYKTVIEDIKNSNIDFTKFGWVNKVALLVGITPQSVNRWMKRNLPQVLETAYVRNSKGKDQQ